MKFVFDSNSLIVGAGSPDGLLPSELALHVPLATLQELLFQPYRSSAEGRARKAIVALDEVAAAVKVDTARKLSVGSWLACASP
jgi:hypothetical protein